MGTVLIHASVEDALPFVQAGVLRIDPDGSIWRCKVRHAGYWGAKWSDREPTRAEHDSRNSLDVRLSIGSFQRIVVPAAPLVWTVLVGPIPAGLRVYRRDGDHRNNDPKNLYVAFGHSNYRGSLRVFDDDYIDQLRGACDHPHERRLLEAIITHGSQTHAAEALGYDQPSLSRFMKKLVARIGDQP